MPKIGVKYYRRGRHGQFKVGFFYFEIIISYLKKFPEGKKIPDIADATKISYDTTRVIMAKLKRMNRVEVVFRKNRMNRVIKYYKLTEWRLE